MAACNSDVLRYDHDQQYEDHTVSSPHGYPESIHTPDDPRWITGDPDSLRLNTTAPSFVPVKSSKLAATAPSFLLSHLAIFDSPADGLAERPHKCKLVLPDAGDDKITDSIEMMQCPRDGQIGRFTDDTTIEFNNGWHHNDPVIAAMHHAINARKENLDVFALKEEVLKQKSGRSTMHLRYGLLI
jgi:hypothetical protein